MTLDDILNSLPHGSWLDSPQQVLQHKSRIVLSKKECRCILARIGKSLDEADAKAGCNYLFLGLALGEHLFLVELQKAGMLRSSRYLYRTESLTQAVSPFLSTDLGLSEVALAYLDSVASLYTVARSIRQEYELIRDWLAEKREAGIKGLLAGLDLLFLKKAIGIHETNKKDLPSRHPFFFSVNQLADGFSSVLALYGNEFGELRWNTAIPEDVWRDGTYLDLLVSSAHLAVFRQWEFQVDRMGYRLRRDGTPDSFRLFAPSQEFLRAEELGFIQSRAQDTVKAAEWLDPKAPSLRKMGTRVASECEKHGLIQLVTEPVRRYRFGVPPEVLTKLIRIPGLFQEERMMLLEASRALLVPPGDLLSFQLEDGVTFRDFLMVSRLIQFLRHMTAAKLVPELKSQPGVVFQSLIPAYTADTLTEIVGTVIDKSKAKTVTAIMTTRLTGHVDIQYRPLLAAGEAILLPANIFANSNVFRNPLLTIQRRLFEDGANDPLVARLCGVFDSAGFKVLAGIEYDEGDIDVLAYNDSCLFSFECKNSLLPADVHELRTSLDYVEKASEQLTRLARRWEDRTFRGWLAERTGWSLDRSCRFASGIVMSNRMFIGLRVNGHPVRGSYELEQFLLAGTVGMGEERRSFWSSDKLAAEDLVRYLNDDITYQPLWQSMREFSENYVFAQCKVAVNRMFLDTIALANALGFPNVAKELPKVQEQYERFVSEYSFLDEYPESKEE